MMKRSNGWMPAWLGLALVTGTMRAEDAKPAEPKADGAKPAAVKAEKLGPKKVLEKFDSNGDGKITGAEAEALRKAFAGKWKNALERYDTDRNGKLDDAEIAAIKPKKGGKKAKKE